MKKEFIVKHNVEDLFKRVELEDSKTEEISVEKYSYWKSVFKSVIKKPSAIISLSIILIIVLFALFAPMFSKYDVLNFSPSSANAYLEPNAKHWFGTDGMGRDMWTLVWTGTRTSLSFAVVVALINTVLGIVIGSIWGFFKKLDPIMIELRNFIYNIPSLLLYVLLLFVLPRSFWTLVFILTLFGWMGLANFVRNQIIIIQNREYNIASNTLGSKPLKIITHNLLPYLVSVIVTVVSTAIPEAISAEVGLSFFGLSFASDEAITIGRVLNNAASSGVWIEKPYVIIFSAFVVVSLTISFFTLGLNLADATDPKNHR